MERESAELWVQTVVPGLVAIVVDAAEPAWCRGVWDGRSRDVVGRASALNDGFGDGSVRGVDFSLF
jgi:hypothetical protein